MGEVLNVKHLKVSRLWLPATDGSKSGTIKFEGYIAATIKSVVITEANLEHGNEIIEIDQIGDDKKLFDSGVYVAEGTITILEQDILAANIGAGDIVADSKWTANPWLATDNIKSWHVLEGIRQRPVSDIVNTIRTYWIEFAQYTPDEYPSGTPSYYLTPYTDESLVNTQIALGPVQTGFEPNSSKVMRIPFKISYTMYSGTQLTPV